MNKFSIKKEAITSFEIECNFGSIYIDTTDIELPLKVENMYDTAKKGQEKYDKRQRELKALKISEDEKDKETIKAQIEYINTTYKAIEKLFGEGATDKVFRVKSITALEMFLDDIAPLLEKFNTISQERLNERVKASKYEQVKPLDNDIEELE